MKTLALDQAVDKIGILSSLLCIAHCLFVPILGVFSITMITASEVWHQAFILLSLGSFVALIRPWRRRFISTILFFLACLGAAFLILGLFFVEITAVLTVIGGLFLMVGHVQSLRRHRVTHESQKDCCNCP